MKAEAAQALAWLAEMGADEAILPEAIDRFAESAALKSAPASQDIGDAGARPALNRPAAAQPPAAPPRLPVAAAVPAMAAGELEAMAQGCTTLDELAQFLDGFDACPLKRTATRLCFADGLPGAHLMIVGEAPGRDEDEQGLPFVGRSGQLLDRMLKAAGFDRRSDDPATSVFITNAVFWRPPGNRNPSTAELLMCLPFVRRAIELAAPRVIMTAGNIPTQSLLDISQGITRARGTWRKMTTGSHEIDVMPAYHPSFLLRSPEAKRLAWRDLLAVKQRLGNR
ncbi:MAG: uracil-DNA glycosylase [Anderseniella sp.]|nr:uracil-DNA glycosylase [Anderseniella sp.]